MLTSTTGQSTPDCSHSANRKRRHEAAFNFSRLVEGFTSVNSSHSRHPEHLIEIAKGLAEKAGPFCIYAVSETQRRSPSPGKDYLQPVPART